MHALVIYVQLYYRLNNYKFYAYARSHIATGIAIAS